MWQMEDNGRSYIFQKTVLFDLGNDIGSQLY